MPTPTGLRLSLRDFLRRHARISRSRFYRDYRHDPAVIDALDLEEDLATGALSVNLAKGLDWARTELGGRRVGKRADRAKRLGVYAEKGNLTCPVCGHGARKQDYDCPRCGAPLPSPRPG